MYHTIIIVGNLGRDPEMRYIPSGQGVTTLSVATSRQYKNNDGQQVKETIWFRVSVWGKQAEFANNYLRKGNKVLIEGRLRPGENGNPRVWTGNDGVPHASYEVSATTIQNLTPRGETPGAGGTEDVGDTGVSEEEIPF